MKIKKLTTLAMLTALSLIIFLIEASIPPIVPIAGVKMGLANIITLTVLMNFSAKDAFMVCMTRIFLGTFLTGSLMSLIYSLLGAIISLIAMIAVNKFLHGKYIFLTSIIGAIFHNIGQIIAAIALTSTPYVVSYLPILMISGIITGTFTGLCAYFSNRYLSRFIKKWNNL